MTARRRVVAAVAALVAAAGLAVHPLGGTPPANAVTDPISGFGSTSSAVTLKWADGITGADNRTIVAPRQPKGTSAFVDDLWNGYQNLTVAVSQTQSLTHQGVQITWTGGAATDTGQLIGNYLQIMQCYGDASTGPDPEYCQWGGYDEVSLPPGPSSFVEQDWRSGSLCVPTGSGGCDPAESDKPDHIVPGDTHPYLFMVPFVPVNTNQKIYTKQAPLSDPTMPSWDAYFQGQSTNEVPTALTSSDGTGQVSFEVQSGREASGLGCGDPDTASGGAPRGCWSRRWRR